MIFKLLYKSYTLKLSKKVGNVFGFKVVIKLAHKLKTVICLNNFYSCFFNKPYIRDNMLDKDFINGVQIN